MQRFFVFLFLGIVSDCQVKNFSCDIDDVPGVFVFVGEGMCAGLRNALHYGKSQRDDGVVSEWVSE